MKGFAYFSSWLIEGRQGILEELREELQGHEEALRELEVERGMRLQLEAELKELKLNCGGGGGGEGQDDNGDGNDQKKSCGGGGRGPQAGSSSSATKKGGKVKQLEGIQQNIIVPQSQNVPGTRRKLELEPEVKDEDGATSTKKLKTQKRSAGRGITQAPAVDTPLHPVSAPAVVETQVEVSQGTPTKKGRGRPIGSSSNSSQKSSTPKALNLTDLVNAAKRMTAVATTTPGVGEGSRSAIVGGEEKSIIIPGGSESSMSASSQSQHSIDSQEAIPIPQLEAPEAPEGLGQLWAVIIDSCLPNSETATQKSSLQRVAKVQIPLVHQLSLVHLICSRVGAQGREGTCSQLLHSLKLLESLFNNLSVDLEDHAVLIRQTIEGSFSAILKNLHLEPTSEPAWGLLNLTARLLGKAVKLSKMDRDRATVVELFKFRLGQVLDYCQKKGKDLSLVSLYHTIFTVKEIGKKETKALILPKIAVIGGMLQLAEESALKPEFPEVDNIAIKKIQALIMEIALPLLVSTRRDPDLFEDYDNEFGSYFGERLLLGVQQLRAQKEAQKQKRRTQSESLT